MKVHLFVLLIVDGRNVTGERIIISELSVVSKRSGKCGGLGLSWVMFTTYAHPEMVIYWVENYAISCPSQVETINNECLE